jgi:hypothetical protein
VPNVTALGAVLLTLSTLCSPNTQLQALEVAQHLRGSLEHPHIGAGQCALSGKQLEIEMGPAVIQMQRGWRGVDSGAELQQLADVVRGREDVRPPRGPQIFPVHDDHRRTPSECVPAPDQDGVMIVTRFEAGLQ